ncbi:MAG: hypothetical protein ACRDD7_08785 [Peptostreptococcaceae bacterium]
MIEGVLQSKYPNEGIEKLSMYRMMALDLCMNYFKDVLNIDITSQQLEEGYSSPLLLIIFNAIDFEESKGLKSIKQGNKSKSFNTYENKQFVLTDEIKAFFPLPVVRLEG